MHYLNESVSLMTWNTLNQQTNEKLKHLETQQLSKFQREGISNLMKTENLM